MVVAATIVAGRHTADSSERDAETRIAAVETSGASDRESRQNSAGLTSPVADPEAGSHLANTRLANTHLANTRLANIPVAPVSPFAAEPNESAAEVDDVFNQRLAPEDSDDSLVVANPIPAAPPKPLHPDLRLPTVAQEELVTFLTDDVRELELFKSDREAARRISALNINLRDRSRQRVPEFNLFSYTKRRRDIDGIPFIMGDECHIDEDTSQTMARISRDFGTTRTSLDRARRTRETRPEVVERQREALLASGSMTEEQVDAAIARMYGGLNGEERSRRLVRVLDNELERGSARSPELAVSTFVQLCQGEDATMRKELVRLLGKIDCKSSSEALANLACFDIDASVRDAAVEQLRNRDKTEFTNVLVDNLWYPWAPVSINSAKSLAKIGRDWTNHDALNVELTELLKLPDPAAPYKNEEGEWHVKELVKVNHMKNCMLCHEAQTEVVSLRSDEFQVPGRVPVPGQQIPIQYYQSQTGSFVDASTTYLRQDFSMLHDVPDHGPWPERQRFDYFLRERKLSPTECHDLETKLQESETEPENDSFAQRDAVKYVLHRFQQDSIGQVPVELLSERARVDRVKEYLNLE